MKTVHGGDSADQPKVPKAEKKAVDKARLCSKLHICVCSQAAKLELRTPYKNPARRDLVEGQLALHLRARTLCVC